MTETTQKKKMGRPKKERTGKHIWIPAEFIDMVQAIIETAKQQQQKQATQ